MSSTDMDNVTRSDTVFYLMKMVFVSLVISMYLGVSRVDVILWGGSMAHATPRRGNACASFMWPEINVMPVWREPVTWIQTTTWAAVKVWIHMYFKYILIAVLF